MSIQTGPSIPLQKGSQPPSNWHESLAAAIRDPDVLIDSLALPAEYRQPAREAATLFPLIVPRSYLSRIEPQNPRDPLLLQVLPLGAEFEVVADFVADALHEGEFRTAPGLLQKYAGRALMIATGACAVHCRYCFRRHYPYGEEPRRLDEWEPAFAAIETDRSLKEILLSGGDPLMLTDSRLAAICNRLSSVEHLQRLRLHTRLPIVLPDRVTAELVELLTSMRLTPIVVVHANHAHEIVDDCAEALRTLVKSGITVLNQSVLLRGVNDSVEELTLLSERLVDLGVLPYYLHQLDRVAGAAHFQVPESVGKQLVAELRRRLPGYAVPKYVCEVPGEEFKRPLT